MGFDRLAWELAPGQKIGPARQWFCDYKSTMPIGCLRYLNGLHPESKGRYAEVITSDVSDADELIRKFKYEDYPQVAVSVDMLNTGFDCRDFAPSHVPFCTEPHLVSTNSRARDTNYHTKQRFVI